MCRTVASACIPCICIPIAFATLQKANLNLNTCFLLHNLASQSTQLTCCQMIFIQMENYPKEYMYLQKYKWNLGCSSNIFVFICIKLLPPFKFYKHFDCLNHSTIKENRCRLVNVLTEKAMIIRC